MKTLFTPALVAMLSLLLYATTSSADPKPTKLPGPAITIDDALRIAKQLVQKQNVNIANSYIDSTRLEQNRNGDRSKVWIVTWLRNEFVNGSGIKGGQTYVHVYMDGTGEINFGE